MSERISCKVLGKEIGTYDGWDQVDTFGIIFYKFTPNDRGKEFLRCSFSEPETLLINFETGQVAYYQGDKDEDEVQCNPNWSVFND